MQQGNCKSEGVYLGQPSSSGSKKALMIAPFAFMPDWEGSRKRIRQMLDLLDSAGYEVHYLLVQMYDADTAAMERLLSGSLTVIPNEADENLGQAWYWKYLFAKYISRITGWNSLFNFHHDGWYFPKIGEVAEQLVKQHGIELVVCEYLFYSKALDRFDQLVKVIDTCDVFADRYKVFLESGRRPSWYSTSMRGEKESLGRADIVVAISDNDAEVFKSYGLADVQYLPYVPAAVASADTVKSDVLELCFVGSGNDFNFSALSAFFEQVMPALDASGVCYRLSVFGQICTRYVESPYFKQESVYWGGVVDDLTSVFVDCDALVNPLAAGTGLPIKVLDSLAHGLHVLGTDAGLRGLRGGFELDAIHVCDDAEEWVASCRALLARKNDGENLRAIARLDHENLLIMCQASGQVLTDKIAVIRASKQRKLSSGEIAPC